MALFDLHTHSIFSDGSLIPAELVRRAHVIGLTGIGITDHGDSSNIELIIPRIVSFAEEINSLSGIRVIAGIEITHVPPSLIAGTVNKARSLGAGIVVAHGETLVEPVAPGTNRAAIEAGVDIVAHPGLITEEDASLAKEKGICLEISGRKGHCLANGHVAAIARKTGAKLVLNSDAHDPGDLFDNETAKRIVFGAGLVKNDFDIMQNNAASFFT